MESFDWNFYLENNKDLVENGISTQEDAFTHWENFGINEGRSHKFLSNYFLEKYFKKFLEHQEKNELNKEDAWDLLIEVYNKNNNPEEKDISENDKEMDIENFDWKFYIEKNDDLRKSGILTKELAIKHWTDCGKFENRKFKKIINKNNNNNINIKNVTFDNFDWKFYLINNLDLVENSLISKDQAWSHWINYGRYENRKVNTIIPKQENIKSHNTDNFTNLEEKSNIDYLINEENTFNKKNTNYELTPIERIKSITNNLSNNKQRSISNIIHINENENNKNKSFYDKPSHNELFHDKKSNDKLSNDKSSFNKKYNHKQSNNELSNDKLFHNKKSHNKKSNDKQSHNELSHNELSHDKQSHDESSNDKQSHDKSHHSKKSHDKSFNNELSHDKLFNNELFHDKSFNNELFHDKSPYNELSQNYKKNIKENILKNFNIKKIEKIIDSSDEEPSKEELIDEESSKEESIDEESLNEESINEESTNEESIDEESITEKELIKNVINDHKLLQVNKNQNEEYDKLNKRKSKKN